MMSFFREGATIKAPFSSFLQPFSNSLPSQYLNNLDLFDV